jgi:SAM-dependent methyltransferase
MMDHPRCRICGETDHSLISNRVAGAPASAVYLCGSCGIVYQHPIMTEEEETRFYALEFDRYMQSRSGPNWRSPEEHFFSHQGEGERRLPLVRPFLDRKQAVLEIGSATGYFLDDLRAYAGTVTGVEPNPEHARYARSQGIETYPSLDSLGDRSFDCIALYYVLEHARDPVGLLRRLKTLLRASGCVFIEVPNVDDALISTYSIPQFSPFYWQKAHYYYFSRHTLKHTCERAGFNAEVLPVQRYDLSNHLVWMMEGNPGGAGRFKHLFTPELEVAYTEALKKHWICDTVFCVARVA